MTEKRSSCVKVERGRDKVEMVVALEKGRHFVVHYKMCTVHAAPSKHPA